ncbi:phage portal protein [Teichococcus aestuarii]|uniref:phage portal protein n=1 Tax=Teichococcus aestuarii TaxID=568898 RepID=UPI00361B783E
MGLLQRLAAPFTGAASPARERVEPVLPPVRVADAEPASAGAEPAPALAAGPPDSNVHHPEQWLVSSFGRPSSSGRRVSESDVLTLPAAMQALRVLCGVFAMTPLHYYRETENGRERAKGDPLHALFHSSPNQVQTAFAFKELLLGDLLLTGNFGAYVSRNRLQVPTALSRVDPNSLAPAEYFDRSEGISLFFDATLPDGSRERFASRDLWHVAGMGRGLVGLNPVTFMRDAFGAALSTGEYAARFWSNDAKPAVVLTTDQKVPRETKGEIRRDWDALHAGASRAHGTAVLDHNLKPQFMSHDNEKSQFLDTRVFQVVEVARIWGVPPHLLFELSKATFSNIEQQSLEFVTYHLGPHYERVAQAATKAFAAPGCYFEFLVDALVKGDLKSRWEAYRIQRETGVVSADEIRDRENLNRVGGRAGAERWRPANMHISGTDPIARGSEPRQEA